jgi:outer membrane protein assembly factor BamB
MKKIIISFLLITLLTNCSFDDKTGIWENEEQKKKISKKNNKNTVSVFKDEKFILEEVSPNKEYTFQNKNKKLVNDWSEKFQNHQNNIENINYNNKKEILFKSSKIPGKIFNEIILFKEDNVFYSDSKGNIYVYSIKDNSLIFKYNFYKKKYKKIKKILNIAVKYNIIYVADNLGFVYALDYNQNKMLWAKEIGIPLKSNIKIYNEQLFISTDTNKIFALNSKDGSTNWNFFTDTATIQKIQKNNFSLDKFGNLIFFNTNNSAYAWNLEQKKLKWIVDLKLFSLDKNSISNIKTPVVHKNNVLLSSNDNLYLYDTVDGRLIWRNNISALFKPIISNDNIFIVTNNDFIVNISLFTGKIIWAKKIDNLLINSDYSNLVKKIGDFKSFYLSNEQLIFFSNKYMLELNISKSIIIERVTKVPKLNSGAQPIFINNNMLIVSDNRIYKFN